MSQTRETPKSKRGRPVGSRTRNVACDGVRGRYESPSRGRLIHANRSAVGRQHARSDYEG